MRGGLPFLAAATLLFAGCAGTSGVGPEELPTETDPGVGPKTGADRGAIQGVVMDDQFAPLLNASVSLETTDAKPTQIALASTEESGRFSFSLVEPGTYRARATLLGFSEGASLVQVSAGEVTEVRITLTVRPIDLPYVDVRVFNGIAGCDSVGVIVSFVTIGGICPTQASSAPGYSTNYTDSWRYLVWELTWDSATEFLGFLVSPSTFTCDQEPCYGVTVGPPPLRLDGAPGMKMQEDTEFYNAPTGSIIAFPEGAFSTAVGAYHGGMFGSETTNALAPASYCPDYCYGVGTTLERRFSVYESTFHFAAPPDPGTYSALPDT